MFKIISELQQDALTIVWQPKKMKKNEKKNKYVDLLWAMGSTNHIRC